MAPIVFIHRLNQTEQQQWLARLRELLVNETIVLVEQLDACQVEQVEIAIVANPDPLMLRQFPNLRWVQSLWAGVERLVDDFRVLNNERQQAAQQSIQLIRLIDPQLAQTMAEAVLAWTLYLHRQMPQYMQQQRLKQWRPLHCPAASDIRVSVLGAGELGVCAMGALVNQGFQVSCWSRSAKNIINVQNFNGAEQLAPMLNQTDILVCLLPLTEQTRGLLNSAVFDHLPKGAKLINFGRGPVVNHADLMGYLDSGHLEHAVLDVFEHEPLAEDSPLWEHANISVLPHISAATNVHTASMIAANNIVMYRDQGVIPQAVDLQLGY